MWSLLASSLLIFTFRFTFNKTKQNSFIDTNCMKMYNMAGERWKLESVVPLSISHVLQISEGIPRPSFGIHDAGCSPVDDWSAELWKDLAWCVTCLRAHRSYVWRLVGLVGRERRFTGTLFCSLRHWVTSVALGTVTLREPRELW